MKEIERLQDNLMLLRITANWSVQDLADKLDVTRQTVNNLEIKKTTMTKIQYLAIRSCFAYEEKISDNRILSQLLYCLVDHPEKMNDDDRKLIAKQAKILSSAAKGGSSKEEIYDMWLGTLSILGAAALIGTFAVGALDKTTPWIEAIMSKKGK